METHFFEKKIKKMEDLKKLYYELEDLLEILSGIQFDIMQGTFNYDFVPEKNRGRLFFIGTSREEILHKQSHILDLILDLSKKNETQPKNLNNILDSIIQKHDFYNKNHVYKSKLEFFE